MNNAILRITHVKVLLIAFMMLMSTVSLFATDTCLFVSPEGAGLRNGRSWENAYSADDIFSDSSRINCERTSLYLKSGVYHIQTDTITALRLYGGYEGKAGTCLARDTQNQTLFFGSDDAYFSSEFSAWTGLKQISDVTFFNSWSFRGYVLTNCRFTSSELAFVSFDGAQLDSCLFVSFDGIVGIEHTVLNSTSFLFSNKIGIDIQNSMVSNILFAGNQYCLLNINKYTHVLNFTAFLNSEIIATLDLKPRGIKSLFDFIPLILNGNEYQIKQIKRDEEQRITR